MSRCNWHIIAAIVGWLIVVSTASGQENATQEKPKPKGEIAQSMDGIAAAIKEVKEHLKPDTGCTDGAEDRNSDLCAQWKAADAAKESADWTRQTFFLGIAGTVIGFFTLCAAIAAAVYAKRAAKHASDGVKFAEDSVSAANDTVSVTREVGRDQSRAYLHVDKVEFLTGGDDRNASAMAWVKNSGQTPAEWFYVVSTANLYPIDYTHPFAIEVDRNVDRGITWNTLGGGDSLSVPIRIDTEVIEAIKIASQNTDGHQIIVSGFVQYKTLFSEVYETDFMFVGRPLPRFKYADANEAHIMANRDGRKTRPSNEAPHKLQRAGRRLSAYKRIETQGDPK